MKPLVFLFQGGGDLYSMAAPSMVSWIYGVTSVSIHTISQVVEDLEKRNWCFYSGGGGTPYRVIDLE